MARDEDDSSVCGTVALPLRMGKSSPKMNWPLYKLRFSDKNSHMHSFDRVHVQLVLRARFQSDFYKH